MLIDEYKKVTPRNGRYTDEMLTAKEMFYENFLSIK